MIIRIERGQKLYIADEPDRVFEGALLDLDTTLREARLDPLAELTLDPQTKSWSRTPLPKGPARRSSLAVVHDEENEARHYAQRGYTSPLGDAGAWAHPSKRVWTLAVNESQPTVPAAAPVVPVGHDPAVTVEIHPVTPRRVPAPADSERTSELSRA